jgi:MFS family permease
VRRWWLVALLVLAVLPDALSYPGLKVVISERFGQSDASTQYFSLAALFGAFLALPILRRVRHLPLSRLILIAGIAQALVVGAMALPISWGVLLCLRMFQGGLDLFTLAILTGAVARSLGGTGRTFGIVGSAIMGGLACGFGLGGFLAGISPLLVFEIGAVLALVMGIGALAIQTQPSPEQSLPVKVRMTRTLIGGIAFAGSDRFLAGVSTVVLPLLLADTLGLDLRTIGLVMGLPLLMAVFGGVLAGLCVDRYGVGRVRLLGSVAYGLGLAVLVVGGGGITSLLFATAFMALGITALLPTALVLGTRRDGTSSDAAVVGRIQMGGQAGYIIGVLGASAMTAVIGSASISIVLLAVGVYLTWNGGWLLYDWRSMSASIQLADRSTLEGFIHRDHKRRRAAIRTGTPPRRAPVSSVND